MPKYGAYLNTVTGDGTAINLTVSRAEWPNKFDFIMSMHHMLEKHMGFLMGRDWDPEELVCYEEHSGYEVADGDVIGLEAAIAEANADL